MRRILLAIVLSAGLFAMAALGDSSRTLATSGSRLDHGDWQRLPDAGFRFGIYGVATVVEDGGTEQAPNAVICECGAFSNAPSVCLPLWRAANGL